MKIDTIFSHKNRVFYEYLRGAKRILFFIFALNIIFSIENGFALEIKNIISTKNVHAWLVEDYTVPVISMQFSFKGGAAQDPTGKEGLASLLSTLFDEGAGEFSADRLQEKLDDVGASLFFSVNQDSITGKLQVLAENKQEAFQLLALVLQSPRFDQDAIERMRAQLIANLRASERDPSTIAHKKFLNMVYGKHPYGRVKEGSIESLGQLTRSDLIAAHQKMVTRDNVTIGLVGPLSPDQAKQLIEQVFDHLPQQAQLQKIAEAQLHLGGMATVPYPMPQTELTLLYPGVKRQDPDFFAAYLMNELLGGSGLTSILFNEIREKRGLVYTINSRLVNFDHASSLMISTATRADQAQKTLETVRSEIKKIIAKGISQQQLDAVKNYVLGAYFVQNMGSSAAIAAVLTGLQEQNLPIDYIEKREALIKAVTVDDVNAVARKIFDVEPAILLVGSLKG